MTFLTIVQFVFMVVIGVYFWTQLRSQRSNKKAIKKKSKKELKKLHKLRNKSLTKPLAEKIRPTDFSEIVGQKDGIKALKAALCGPNPQHVIIYGPPGTGKTAAARLVLEEARQNPDSPFDQDSDFEELDATTARFDERGIADPLIGSVHDPIYQGAGAMGSAGIPQPKPGAVTKAHGGILFLDEIGELHSIQMNKLLKVLEDRKVWLESAYYYEEDKSIPRHIHEIFQNGLPADFRLIGATTKRPDQIPPAIRSRCLEIFFNPLTPADIADIVNTAGAKLDLKMAEEVVKIIKKYAVNGREAVNMVQTASGIAAAENRNLVQKKDIERVIVNGQYTPRDLDRVPTQPQIGVVNGLAVIKANQGTVDQLEVSVTKVNSGRGELNITGVAQEAEQGTQYRKIKRKSMVRDSAENVLTVIKKMLNINLDNYDIHIDFTSDAVVDGPSAGISMAVALYSAFTEKPVDNLIAMTGKLSVNGQVRPIGGVVPKVRAAIRAGAERVLIPAENWQQIFTSQEFAEIEIIKVNHLKEALQKAVQDKPLTANEEIDFNIDFDSLSASVI